MPRLAAIVLLCIAFSIPALALDEEGVPTGANAAEGAAIEEIEDVDLAIGGEHPDIVAIVVPTMLFLTVLLGVVSTHRLRIRKQAQLHQTLRLMIEKGTDIPPELLTPPDAAHADLRRGLVWVSIGLSLVILIGMTDGFTGGSWAVGLVPAFIGAAYLVIWWYSQRESNC